MPRLLKAGIALLLLLLLVDAGAQNPVYRCGASTVYTDKPCTDATPVDLTKQDNILQHGPTWVPPPPPQETNPNPVTIWPNSTRIVNTPPAPPSSIWGDRDARSVSSPSTTPSSLSRSGSANP